MSEFDSKQYQDIKNMLINRSIDKNKTIFLIPTHFHYATDVFGHAKLWADAKRGDLLSYMYSDIRDQSEGPMFISSEANTEESMIVKDVYKVNDDIIVEARNGDIYTTIHLGEDLRRAIKEKEIEEKLVLVVNAAKEANRFWKINTAALCKELLINIPKEHKMDYLKTVSDVCANYLDELIKEQGQDVYLTKTDLNKVGLEISKAIWHQQYNYRDEQLQILTNAYLKQDKPVVLISDMNVSDGNYNFYRFDDLQTGKPIAVSCGGQLVTKDGLQEMDRLNEQSTLVSKLREDKGFIIETESTVYTNIEDFAHKCHKTLQERDFQTKEQIEDHETPSQGDNR
jgi:hypothetical protein